MDSWERFDENTIPPKEAFHSELNLEAIRDADYEHFKKVWESFEIKNLGIMICMINAIHNCLLIFLKTLQISVLKYDLDPAHFLSAPGLAFGICQSIYGYAKANNKYMNNHNKGIISSYVSVFRCKQFVWMGYVSKITCECIFSK